MKTRRFAPAFRGLFFVTVCAPISHAAVINVDATTGNLTATSANNGANTIAAKGGTDPAPYTVTVDLGAVLTGDAVQKIGVNVTKAGYTIHNSGDLSGDLDGIRATAAGVSAIINNSAGATITGTGATARGIAMNGDATASITNAGTISGQDDAIRVNSNLVSILNLDSGVISGTTGAASDGIKAAGSATITNHGMITGIAAGIAATTDMVITNSGTITGGTAQGIVGTNGSVTITGGTVSGTAGVQFNGAGTNDSLILTGGSLIGTGTNAALLGGGSDLFEISGTASVTGTVNMGTENDTANLTGGVINGTLSLGDGDDLLTISGVTSATSVTGGNGADTLIVSATHTGNIDAGADNDIITLETGASVVGDVIAGIGNDTVTLNGNSISGSLNLGEGDDLLTLNGSNTIASLIGGNGNDSITISETHNGDIDAGLGDDTFNLLAGAQVNGNVLLGGGNDLANISGGIISRALNLGEGDDNLVLTGTNKLNSIIAGNGIDTLSISGNHTGNIDAGGGDDIITLNSDTVVNGAISGAADYDSLTINGNVDVIGNLSSIEDIQKTGTGASRVFGTIQTDSINVNEGGLYIIGNVNTGNAPATINVSGGHFGGILPGATAVWNADLVQTGGTVSPGSTPNVSDPLTSISFLNLRSASLNGGLLVINVDPVGGLNDMVRTTGNVTINGGGLAISPLTQDAPLADRDLVFLEVAGDTNGDFLKPVVLFQKGHTDTGITATRNTGEFTPVTFSISVVPDELYPKNLAFRVVHHYEALPGLSGFGNSFANALNTLTDNPVSDPLLADFLGALDYSDAKTAAATINSYEPAGFLELQRAAVAGATEVHRVVESANDTGRFSRKNNRVWSNLIANGGDSTSYRITAGTAASASLDGTGFGALVSYGSMSDAAGLNADLTATTLGAYIGGGGLVGWQWNGFLGYTMTEGDVNSATTGYSPESDGFQLLASGAYVMQNDRVSWGPTFGFEYVTMEADSTSISNAAGLPNMSASADSLDSMRLLLGVKSEFDLPGRVTPYASMQYAKELAGEWDGYDGSIGGSSFSVNQPVDLGDSLILRAGVIYGFNDTWQSNVGYIGQVSTSSDGTDSHGLNLSIQANF